MVTRLSGQLYISKDKHLDFLPTSSPSPQITPSINPHSFSSTSTCKSSTVDSDNTATTLSMLETLPSEIQYMIFENVFRPSSTEDAAVDGNNYMYNCSAVPTQNKIAPLLVSREINEQAMKAFLDTVPRKVDLFKTSNRNAVFRAVARSRRNLRKRSTRPHGDDLSSILRSRHLKVNVQLEFFLDLECLQKFKELLQSSRDHFIHLNINLGFIDSHGPVEENGYVFKKPEEEMKKIVDDLVVWHNMPRSAVEMWYLSGCQCHQLETCTDIVAARNHLDEVCSESNIPIYTHYGYPEDWPRWFVEDGDEFWMKPRSEVIYRNDIESV